MRAAPIIRLKEAKILRRATDHNGRYGAAQLAALLDWQVGVVARYLGRAPSTISRFGASQGHQDKLAALTALMRDVFHLTDDSLRATRAWFRLPLGTLDGVSPREAIIRGQIKRVRDLVNEMHSGFAG